MTETKQTMTGFPSGAEAAEKNERPRPVNTKAARIAQKLNTFKDTVFNKSGKALPWALATCVVGCALAHAPALGVVGATALVGVTARKLIRNKRCRKIKEQRLAEQKQGFKAGDKVSFKNGMIDCIVHQKQNG